MWVPNFRKCRWQKHTFPSNSNSRRSTKQKHSDYIRRWAVVNVPLYTGMFTSETHVHSELILPVLIIELSNRKVPKNAQTHINWNCEKVLGRLRHKHSQKLNVNMLITVQYKSLNDYLMLYTGTVEDRLMNKKNKWVVQSSATAHIYHKCISRSFKVTRSHRN